MSKKAKKKRSKKYQPAEPVPTVHRYSAEVEGRRDRSKLWRRRLIGYGLLLLLLWLVVWLIWQLAV